MRTALDPLEYLDDLWFLLHHSEDEDRLVLGLTSYLDDSGSDDGSKLVTIGGPVMSRIQFKAFSARWARMLSKHRVGALLHMSDFVGHGKHAGWYPEMKRSLFLDASALIAQHKLYSISIAISQDDFRSELSEKVRENLIGPYAFAFFVAVTTNQTVSEKSKTGPRRISYLVDSGFGHPEQLSIAHQVIVNLEIGMGGFRHTGALGFDTDDNVPALQAADVIAWASRKRQLAGVLPEGFEPLAEVLNEDRINLHAHIGIPKGGIKMLADPINNWLSRNGALPKLPDIVVRRLRELPG
jgi:hypothetical protein